MPHSALAPLFQLRYRASDLRRATFNRVARQFYRRLGGKAKGNKERRIIHVDSNLLVAHIERLVERQRQVKREDALVAVEPIVLRWLQGKFIAVADMDEGEIVEVLERKRHDPSLQLVD